MYVISGVSLTSTSYDHAVVLLKVHLGQPKKNINAHMQALVHNPMPPNTFFSLRLFYDTVESHIRELAVLELVESTNGALLGPVIINSHQKPREILLVLMQTQNGPLLTYKKVF